MICAFSLIVQFSAEQLLSDEQIRRMDSEAACLRSKPEHLTDILLFRTISCTGMNNYQYGIGPL